MLRFEDFLRLEDFGQNRATAEELSAMGGAGLGLSIVKSICAAHEGRVSVESSEGKGSRFRVELPLANGQARSQGRIEFERGET